MGPPWIAFNCPGFACPTDAWLDLGNLGAKSTTQSFCCASQIIPKPFLFYGRTHYPAERYHSQQGILFLWKAVNALQHCLGRLVPVKVTAAWMAGSRVSQENNAHSLCRLPFSLYHILLPGIHQIRDAHTSGHPSEPPLNFWAVWATACLFDQTTWAGLRSPHASVTVILGGPWPCRFLGALLIDTQIWRCSDSVV